MCSKKSDEGVMRRWDFSFERAFFYGVCVIIEWIPIVRSRLMADNEKFIKTNDI